MYHDVLPLRLEATTHVTLSYSVIATSHSEPAAHEHSYERNYPVYQSMWNPNITGTGAYVNYDRPIHILSGAAGCPENQDPWQPTGNPFSALRLNVYGYGRLQVSACAMLSYGRYCGSRVL